jgi:hypothetical protein
VVDGDVEALDAPYAFRTVPVRRSAQEGEDDEREERVEDGQPRAHEMDNSGLSLEGARASSRGCFDT